MSSTRSDRFDRNRLLKRLLEKLTETEGSQAQLRALIASICREQGLVLSEAENDLLDRSLVDFFIPQPVVAPAEKGSLRGIEAQTAAELEALPEPPTPDAQYDLVTQILNKYLAGRLISRHELQRLKDRIISKVYGFGVLEEFLMDDSVTEILVQGTQPIQIIREGKGEQTTVAFESESDLMKAVHHLFKGIGQVFDDIIQLITFNTPDGSRVTVAGTRFMPANLIVHIIKADRPVR